ncbi:MAG: 4Fe-4S binding protein [Deltaproteobacteria bacterium]|nr:4Fe-4S binding protein [Deltaproteobacteria bacterium]
MAANIMIGRWFKKISGYREIILLLIVISWFLIQGTAMGQEPEFLPLEQTGSFEAISVSEFPESFDASKNSQSKDFERFKYPIAALLLTVFAGIMFRFKKTRLARPLFLMGSLVIFGFINGGCPCIISSFQNFILMVIGVDFKINNILWFLGIVVITYFFGRVWCGWVCHLGALQEFIYRSNSFEFLRNKRAQEIMRWIRYVLFAALIAQLITTQEILFSHVDPFKVAFNLSSYYTAGWILLAILIITSLFIYRPFCRAVCPVGLILGCISMLPGAFNLEKNGGCAECQTCRKVCKTQAIDGYANVDNSDCIMCGDCLDSCKKEGISFYRGKKTLTHYHSFPIVTGNCK